MNAQTPGPLSVDTLSGQLKAGGGTVAATYDLRHDRLGHEEDANRKLLAAAYTAFDQAGRELRIDAATLAESIDLAALIRGLRQIAKHKTSGRQSLAASVAIGLLTSLPK